MTGTLSLTRTSIGWSTGSSVPTVLPSETAWMIRCPGHSGSGVERPSFGDPSLPHGPQSVLGLVLPVARVFGRETCSAVGVVVESQEGAACGHRCDPPSFRPGRVGPSRSGCIEVTTRDRTWCRGGSRRGAPPSGTGCGW